MWRVGGVIKPWHVHRGVSRTWEAQWVPEGFGRETEPKGKVNDDPLGVGSSHSRRHVAAEGDDSHVNTCGRKHIPDKVELDQI
jgi:hypothetical protein